MIPNKSKHIQQSPQQVILSEWGHRKDVTLPDSILSPSLCFTQC